MLNRGDSGRSLENLRENIELFYDDRTGFKVHIDELIEDPQSPGVLTKPEYADILGFNEENNIWKDRTFRKPDSLRGNSDNAPFYT